MTGAGESSLSSKPPFHPAFGVNNIKNSIPLVLNQTDSHYASWVELFHIHTCAYDVIDHIDPTAPKPADIDQATWNRLDAIVKQWILATISTDLLQSIMTPGATAQQLWNSLADIFQDNKATRAVYLEEQFNNTRLDAFPNIHEYFSRIKNLADQLANVGHPVSDEKKVLQLIAGLPKGDYDTIATFIQQSDPLPSFNKARSQLALEETRRLKQESHTPQVLVTQKSDTPPATESPPTRDQPLHSDRGSSRGGFRGRGRGRSGRGGSRPPYPWAPQRWYSENQWSPPPCPYPTAPNQMGLLGPGPRPMQQPQQVFYSGAPYMPGTPMTPTELDAAFSTMHLQQPDNTWYMDTGSTSHVANDAGSYNGETHN